MPSYPLASLLSSRKFREDAAAREVRLAREAIAEAKAAEAAAREELVRYRKWRPGEELRLFELLRGKTMPQIELDRHRGDIQALRGDELTREEDCTRAEKAVKDAEAELEKARARQAAAIRNREKLDKHREIWLSGEKQRQEAAEEAELEDFPARSALEAESGPESEP